jgi:hypothetical protein
MSILTYQGHNFEQREQDGYVNLTQMAKAFPRKEVKDWKRTESYSSYLAAVSSEVNIPASQLLVSLKGNSIQFEQGTWAHPLIAIAFAQWLSPEFHVWCNINIKTLLETGVAKPKAPSQIPSPVILLTPEDKLRIVDKSLNLLERLNGGTPNLSDRDKIMFENIVKNAVRTIDNEDSITQEEPQEERKLTLTEIAQAVFGVNVRRGSKKGEDANLGTWLVKRWRDKYDLPKTAKPDKTDKYFNRTTTASAATSHEIKGMNCYPQEDWHLVGELLIENGYALQKGKEYLMS